MSDNQESEFISSQEDTLEDSPEVAVSDVENSTTSTAIVDALTNINNNLVFLNCFLVAELGIVIGILLGLVWKGITKK